MNGGVSKDAQAEHPGPVGGTDRGRDRRRGRHRGLRGGQRGGASLCRRGRVAQLITEVQQAVGEAARAADGNRAGDREPGPARPAAGRSARRPVGPGGHDQSARGHHDRQHLVPRPAAHQDRRARAAGRERPAAGRHAGCGCGTARARPRRTCCCPPGCRTAARALPGPRVVPGPPTLPGRERAPVAGGRRPGSCSSAAGPSTSVRIGPNATVAGRRRAISWRSRRRAQARWSARSLSRSTPAAHVSRCACRCSRAARPRRRSSSGSPRSRSGLRPLRTSRSRRRRARRSRPIKVPAAPPGGLIKGLTGLGAAGLGAAGSSPARRHHRRQRGPGSMSTYSSTLQIGQSAGDARRTGAAAEGGRAAAARQPDRAPAQVDEGRAAARGRQAAGAQHPGRLADDLDLDDCAGHAAARVRAGAPKVLGSGWTSVVATPANPAVAAAVQQLLSAKTTAMLGGAQPLTQTPTAAGQAQAPAGPDLAVLRAVLKATTPVQGQLGQRPAAAHHAADRPDHQQGPDPGRRGHAVGAVRRRGVAVPGEPKGADGRMSVQPPADEVSFGAGRLARPRAGRGVGAARRRRRAAAGRLRAGH